MRRPPAGQTRDGATAICLPWRSRHGTSGAVDGQGYAGHTEGRQGFVISIFSVANPACCTVAGEVETTRAIAVREALRVEALRWEPPVQEVRLEPKHEDDAFSRTADHVWLPHWRQRPCGISALVVEWISSWTAGVLSCRSKRGDVPGKTKTHDQRAIVVEPDTSRACVLAPSTARQLAHVLMTSRRFSRVR